MKDFKKIIEAMDKVLPSNSKINDELIKASPLYAVKFNEYVDDWENGGTKRSLGQDITNFSYYVSDLLRSNKLEDFPKIFEIIEKIIVKNGDELAFINIIYTNFFETLQNLGRELADKVIPFLGLKSKELWKDVYMRYEGEFDAY